MPLQEIPWDQLIEEHISEGENEEPTSTGGEASTYDEAVSGRK